MSQSRIQTKSDSISYSTRSLSPKTLDDANRSVEVVVATEEPIKTWTPEGILPEILLMDGFVLPEGRDRVPFLNSHGHYDVDNVRGSVIDFQAVGDELRALVVISSTAEDDFVKIKEGHITDVSVGAKREIFEIIKEGQSKKYGNKNIVGPALVTTRWTVKEVSETPIGADSRAVFRSGNNTKEVNAMAKSKGEGPELKRSDENEEAKEIKRDSDPGKVVTVNRGLEAQDDIHDLNQIAKHSGEIAAENVLKVERERVAEITSICRNAGVESEDFIRDGASIDSVRAEVLERMLKVQKDGVTQDIPFMPAITITADAKDKFTRAATDSVLVRAGVDLEDDYKLAPGHNELTGFSMREIAREALRIENVRSTGNPMEMIGRAMGTDSFQTLTSNVANKSLFRGWDTANETWQRWCATGTVSDFKAHTSARISELDDLDEIPESQEYKYSTAKDGSETYSIATYGKLYALTRQAMINDDLHALTVLPMRHGEAAARKVGDVAWAVITANANMGDGVALFASGHSNVGTSGAISATTLAEAIKLMKMQKDIKNLRRLNIQPRYVLAPVSLEGSAEQFFRSNYLDVTSGSQQANIYSGSLFERVYEPRLDDNSTTKWYMAGPKGKTVTVFFLQGARRPYMEKKRGWSVDGVEYKVRIDCGAKAMDWRGLVYNAGA